MEIESPRGPRLSAAAAKFFGGRGLLRKLLLSCDGHFERTATWSAALMATEATQSAARRHYVVLHHSAGPGSSCARSRGDSRFGCSSAWGELPRSNNARARLTIAPGSTFAQARRT